MSVEFRLAARADRGAIVAFVNTHWGSRHPLVNLPEYFGYYYEAEGDRLNFALALEEGRITALAGFLPASRGPKPDIWVSLWLADPAVRGVGLELMDKLPTLTGCRALACNNIRPETRPFYEFLGHTTGEVGHFYRLADRPEYHLARVQNKAILPAGGDCALRLFESEGALLESGFTPPAAANPYKDSWYIARRYFHFPHQPYQVYGVMEPGAAAPSALLAARLARAGEAAALRLVDFIGDEALLPRAGAAVEGLMAQTAAEYCDFYCAGIDEALLRQAGFVLRGPDDPNIIPNYLDPPLYENTDYYYFTSNPEGFRLCRADGDQDRPNIPV